MNSMTILIAAIAFFCWGLASFVGKLAANRIGTPSAFFDVIGYALAAIIYCLIIFRFNTVIHAEKFGIFLAFLSGAIGAGGLIAWYYLITVGEASVVVPLTALYPALTVILAFLFLHESITLNKMLGLFFSLLAIYLLSK